MSHFLNSPQGKPLVQKVAQLFKSGTMKVRRNKHLLFLCGGTEEASLRHRFRSWSSDKLDLYRIFLAESAFENLEQDGAPEFINLSHLERLICEIADVIIIFPESVGSWVETGYFSAHQEISRKILIVNDIKYQTARSFLNDGPIHAITQSTRFGKQIYINASDEAIFEPIAQTLNGIKLKRAERISSEELPNLNLRLKFEVVYFLFSLFPVLSPVDVSIIIKEACGTSDFREVRQIISFLYAADHVVGLDDGALFRSKGGSVIMLEIESGNIDAIKSEILETYFKYLPEYME